MPDCLGACSTGGTVGQNSLRKTKSITDRLSCRVKRNLKQKVLIRIIAPENVFQVYFTVMNEHLQIENLHTGAEMKEHPGFQPLYARLFQSFPECAECKTYLRISRGKLRHFFRKGKITLDLSRKLNLKR